MSQKRSYDVPPLFVRVTEKELKIIEHAVKLKYGRVEGNKSEFIRQAVLSAAVNLIKKHNKKKGET